MICATASSPPLVSPEASARVVSLSRIASRCFASRRARISSRLLTSHTVQVTREAKARPIITAFTTISAFRNMPHGERSRGSSAFAVAACAAKGVASHVAIAANTAIRPRDDWILAAPARSCCCWVMLADRSEVPLLHQSCLSEWWPFRQHRELPSCSHSTRGAAIRSLPSRRSI